MAGYYYPYYNENRYNTELTSRSFPTDAWIQTAGYVTVEQIRSRLYMENLDLKASVALTLVDLVQGYQRRFGTDVFVGEMLEEVLLHHPKNVNALLLQVDYLQHQYTATQNPKLYSQLKQTVKQLVDWGYLPLPKEAEESGLGSDEEASFTPQYAQNNSHPKYRNDESRKNALTLSNGRYDEFLEAERIMQVASVGWDNELGEIVDFEDNKEIGVVSRFLSVDPLQKKFPDISPYTFVANNPIIFVDKDGRDIFLSESFQNNEIYMTALGIIANTEIGFNILKIFNSCNGNYSVSDVPGEFASKTHIEFKTSETKLEQPGFTTISIRQGEGQKKFLKINQDKESDMRKVKNDLGDPFKTYLPKRMNIKIGINLHPTGEYITKNLAYAIVTLAHELVLHGAVILPSVNNHRKQKASAARNFGNKIFEELKTGFLNGDFHHYDFMNKNEESNAFYQIIEEIYQILEANGNIELKSEIENIIEEEIEKYKNEYEKMTTDKEKSDYQNYRKNRNN